MNVYVETNFVLELAFQQEESTACEDIIKLCEKAEKSPHFSVKIS